MAYNPKVAKLDFFRFSICVIFLKRVLSRDERRVVLYMDSNISCKCRSLPKKIETKKSNVKPLHPNTPLSNVNPERVIEALKLERKENKELCKRLEKEIQLKCC